MNFTAVRDHVSRMLHHAGVPLRLGENDYKVRGYYSNVIKNDPANEPEVSVVIERALQRREGAFLDVGVNIGQTLIKVLKAAPTRQYIGFEPQIACCFLIDQFLKDNNLTNAKIIPLALSNQSSIGSLTSSSMFDTDASLVRLETSASDADSYETLVVARTLDEVLTELNLDQIAAVKIDVERAEKQVLEGMRETLESFQPIVIFEVLPNFYGYEKTMHSLDQCAQNSKNADEIFALLSDSGYKIFSLDEEGNERLIENFDLNDRANYRGSNYVAYC